MLTMIQSHDTKKSDSYECHTVLVNLEEEAEEKREVGIGETTVLPILIRDLEWYQAAILVAKLQFGLAVLGIPSTFHALGIVPGSLILIILTLITTYAGVLVTQIREIHPEIHNVQDVGELIIGKSGARVIGMIYFLFAVLVVSAGLLTTSIALNALTDHATCTMVFVGLAALMACLIGAPLRDLHRVSWLGWLGMACVLTSVWVLVICLAVRGHPYVEHDHYDFLAPIERPIWGNGNFAACMVSINMQLVSVMGNVSFYSVSAEMRQPSKFTKAVVVGQTFNLVMYLTLGLVVLYIAGQYITSPALGLAGPVVEKICFGIALPGLLVSTILWANVAAKYAFNRLAHVSFKVREADNLVQWCVWTTTFGSVIVLGFLFAGSIPMFDQLMGLTGASAGPLFVLIITGLTQIYILRYTKLAKEEMSRKDQMNFWATYTVSVLFIIFGVFLTVAGIYGSIYSINHAYNSDQIGGPFSCVDNAVLSSPAAYSSTSPKNSTF
ncbi:hypothetical protein L7F22_003289 [Adiantum nelumboides]|nr:hypothetical protein [Adiantum nelumboides]